MTSTSPEGGPAETGDDLPHPDAEAPRPSRTTPRSRLLRASAVMASGSIVSRVLGFVRNFLMGVILGGSTSAASNAVSSANFLPNSIWIFIGGGVLNAILVPAIVRAIERPDRGSDYISRLMTLVVLCAAGLTAISIALVPLLVRVTSGDLQGSTLSLAIALGYWMMPQIMFSALYVMCGQLLNAHESFGPYQWAPVLNNVVAILGALAFLAVWGSSLRDPAGWTLPMILGLAAFNVGGSAAQVLFLGYYVRRLGLRLRPRFGFRGLGLGRLSRMGLWTLAMLGVAQVGIWATRWSTARATATVDALERHGEVGQAALYPGLLTIDSSYMAFMIPQGIIAVALVTAAFPSISRSAAAADHTDVMRQYARTSRLLAVPMMLSTVVFIALAAPIMWVIIGSTGHVESHRNALVLTGYMLGLVPFAATYLIKRVFYAYEDARSPFLMQIPNTLVSLAAVWPILRFVDPQWATATATAVSSVGNLLGWAIGWAMLQRRVHALGAPGESLGRTGVVMGKLLVAGALALALGLSLVLWLDDVVFSSRPVAVLVCGAIGVLMSALFAVVAWLLRVDELRMLGDRLLRRAARRGA